MKCDCEGASEMMDDGGFGVRWLLVNGRGGLSRSPRSDSNAWQALLRCPRSAHSASTRAIIARAPRKRSPEQCRRGCSNFEERSVARSRLLLGMILQVLLSQEKKQCRAAQISQQRTLKCHNNGKLHRRFFLPATAGGMARPRLK